MPDTLITRFEASRTKQEAINFAMACPPRERASLIKARLSVLEGSYRGITGDNSLVVPLMEIPEGTSYREIMNSKASVQDAEAVYQQLFNHIADAFIQAQKQGKPLSIHVGETHPDRGSQMVNIMALHIAERLGITHAGFEICKEKTFQGARKLIFPAFDGWQEYHKLHAGENGHLPERHEDLSPQPDHMLINLQELIPFAQKNGFKTFAIDTQDTDTTTKNGMYLHRERHMLEEIEKNAGNENVITIGGSAHLYGFNALTEGDNNRHRVYINGAQNLFLLPPNHSSYDDETEKRDTFPAFHPLLKTGRVHSFGEAEELAHAANQSIGNRLEREFKEKLAQHHILTGIHAGGRSPVAPERKRA